MTSTRTPTETPVALGSEGTITGGRGGAQRIDYDRQIEKKMEEEKRCCRWCFCWRTVTENEAIDALSDHPYSKETIAASSSGAVDRGRNDRGVPANPVAAAESHDKSVQFVLDDKNSAMQCETNPGGVLAHDSPFGGYFLTSWGLPENEKGGSGGAKRKKKKSV